MVMKSSGLLSGLKRDFGAKKMFESYLSDTVRDGMMAVCAYTRALNAHWTISRVNKATPPCLFIMASRYHNDVTSFQDNVGVKIFSMNNVLIGYGDHHLFRFSLPVFDVAKDMDIITRGEQCKAACIGYSLEHTCKRLENNLSRFSDFADGKDMVTIDFFDLN